MVGGDLNSLQPYMLARTRDFLNESLALADRLPHFLWASMILGSYLGRMRRVEEGFVVISSAARLASACGLTRDPAANIEYDYLLSPPKDGLEIAERVRLAHSIYITDQVLSTLSGLRATYAYDGRGYEIPEEGRRETSITSPSIMDMKVSMMNIFERVSDFARFVCANGLAEPEESYDSLKAQVLSVESSIPSFSDPLGLGPFEAVSTSRPHIFLVHVTVYGSGMVLHSLRASKDPEARREMLRNLRSLVDACEEIRGPKRSDVVHAGLPSMRHVMNAIRVLAHELRAPEARQSSQLSIHYCETIEVLLDFLDDLTISYPAWADAPVPLADVIVPAVNALAV
ncbi:hypothetical protein DL93DRAFT_2165489 [Clavulina sp. PMI_390]|nr:hypothetical protein DL93DRAFT_2165489 [Clavulina sp. PMI_390]